MTVQTLQISQNLGYVPKTGIKRYIVHQLGDERRFLGRRNLNGIRTILNVLGEMAETPTILVDGPSFSDAEILEDLLNTLDKKEAEYEVLEP